MLVRDPAEPRPGSFLGGSREPAVMHELLLLLCRCAISAGRMQALGLSCVKTRFDPVDVSLMINAFVRTLLSELFVTSRTEDFFTKNNY